MDESELEELLQRAIDPYVPVELFYAVLEHIGRGPVRAAEPAGPAAIAALPAALGAAAPTGPEPDRDPGGLEPVPLPDATVLMAQVDQLEAAMAGGD